MKRRFALMCFLAALLVVSESDGMRAPAPFLIDETLPGLYEGVSDIDLRVFRLMVSTNDTAILVMAAIEGGATNVTAFVGSHCFTTNNMVAVECLEVTHAQKASTIVVKGVGRGSRDNGTIVGEIALIEAGGRKIKSWSVQMVKSANGPYSEILWQMSQAAEKAAKAGRTNTVPGGDD